MFLLPRLCWWSLGLFNQHGMVFLSKLQTKALVENAGIDYGIFNLI